MSSKWPAFSLGELSLKITKGTTPTKSDGGFVACGINFIKAESVTPDGRIDPSSFAYVEESVYRKYKRSQLVEDDILFSMAGVALGKVGIVKAEHLPANTNQALALIRLDQKRVLPQYVYYFLRQKSVLHFVNNAISQSAQPNINLKQIGDLEVSLPSLPVQKRIAKILGDLDHKIELNHLINQTLEQMAQAIFKSWFVDFEPVKAKMAAKESWQALQAEGGAETLPDLETWMNLAAMQVISGQTEEALNQMADQQPEQFSELFKTAALFPAAMQDSELGEIPEGWEVGALADVANLNQQSWTKRTIPSEIRYVDLANTKNGVIESTTTYHAGDAPSRARRILSDGDTIVGTVRPGNRSFAFIKRPPKTLTGSTGFAVLSPKQTEFAEFVYITASSDEAINHLAHLADGGAYPAVRPEVVINLPCIVPTERLIAYFHKTVRSFFDQAAVNKLESSTLSVLRDTLLPKLLSGELSVADLELEETADV